MAELSVLEFRAMGSPARVVVDGGPDGLAADVRNFLWRLEQLWSRFLATSEIAALNRAPDCVNVVSPATYTLISYAVRAQEATGGVFNPLMLGQLETHGYRQSWDDGVPVASRQPAHPGTTEPIVLFPEISAVRLPPATRFDPGGIGKGLAIDLAIDRCVSGGATSSSVEIGGDLRVYGTPWYGSAWRIAVANPFDPGTDIATFTPTTGAVTTSSTKKRCWVTDGQSYHHLLDPETGYPSDTDIISVTTCSAETWWSEVAAKAALITGEGRAVSVLETLGTPGAIVLGDGSVVTTDGTAKAAASL